MPVYVLREDFSNIFKIYRSYKTVADVLCELHAGDSQRLNIFEVVETDQDALCETMLRRDLCEKRIDREGGADFLECDAIEMLTVIGHVRIMFEEFAEDREAVRGYASELSTEGLIEPSDEDEKLMRQLIRNREEQEYLALESELLQNKLKRRIGSSSGIRGLATWKTQMRRIYSEEIFRNSDPELYQELLERYYCLDTKAWRKNRPDQYKEIQTTYFSPQTSRAFKFLMLA